MLRGHNKYFKKTPQKKKKSRMKKRENGIYFFKI